MIHFHCHGVRHLECDILECDWECHYHPFPRHRQILISYSLQMVSPRLIENVFLFREYTPNHIKTVNVQPYNKQIYRTELSMYSHTKRQCTPFRTSLVSKMSSDLVKCT